MADIAELVEVIERDNRVALSKLLQRGGIDFDVDVEIDEEGLDEPEEMPLLFWLVMKGVDLEVIEMLVDAGMRLDHYSREGLGVVDIAIKFRRRDVLEYCMERGFSVIETKRKSGMTPLMQAAAFGDMEMVQFLLSHGADPFGRDSYGMNAGDYARRLGYESVYLFFEKLAEDRES